MLGLALSFALHAALLLSWRHGQAPHQAGEVARPPLTVRLRPPPPPPPKAEPVRAAPSSAKAGRAATPTRRRAPDLIALPRQPAAAPPPADAFTVEPPAPAAPHFDPEAARKLARQMANDPDPAKAGTALAQLPRKELENETKAARAIGRAKRRDCKDGIPGGLLAPLLLLMDKKDSGCKW
jgi:hypothetical protein